MERTATTLWGTRIGAEDWREELITDNPALIEQAKAWAEANGFDRIRVAVIDLTVAPDWSKTVNV